jgi:hypothetical protein
MDRIDVMEQFRQRNPDAYRHMEHKALEDPDEFIGGFVATSMDRSRERLLVLSGELACDLLRAKRHIAELESELILLKGMK